MYPSVTLSCLVGGLIPGYWVAFLFIDSWGRKPIQLMGFIVLTALFIIMGKYRPSFHVNIWPILS